MMDRIGDVMGSEMLFEEDEPPCQLVEGWVAGTLYHDGHLLARPLEAGESLRLRAEPDNPRDPLAIEILTEAGIKLGYVPRRLNPGIARRLEAGFDLRCEVTRFTREGDLVGVRFRILSFTPGDTPDPPPEKPAPAPRPWPVHRPPPYQLNALSNCLHQARSKLEKGERLAALGELNSAMNWALDLWVQRHPGEVARRAGWSAQFAAFMHDYLDPLRRRIALLTWVMSALVDGPHVPRSIADEAPEPHRLDDPDRLRLALLEWREDYCGPPGHSSRNDRKTRLDWGYLSEITAVTAILSQDPDAAAPPAWAERLPVNRREHILRVLFRWLRLMDDHERLGVIPVTRLRAVRTLNWDTELVMTLQLEPLRSHLDLTPPRRRRRQVMRRIMRAGAPCSIRSRRSPSPRSADCSSGRSIS